MLWTYSNDLFPCDLSGKCTMAHHRTACHRTLNPLSYSYNQGCGPELKFRAPVPTVEKFGFRIAIESDSTDLAPAPQAWLRLHRPGQNCTWNSLACCKITPRNVFEQTFWLVGMLFIALLMSSTHSLSLSVDYFAGVFIFESASPFSLLLKRTVAAYEVLSFGSAIYLQNFIHAELTQATFKATFNAGSSRWWSFCHVLVEQQFVGKQHDETGRSHSTAYCISNGLQRWKAVNGGWYSCAPICFVCNCSSSSKFIGDKEDISFS